MKRCVTWSVSNIQILFPTALLHIVSCQQHPDKYWPGGEASDLSQPVELERLMQLLGFILPVWDEEEEEEERRRRRGGEEEEEEDT